jgi:hypothetical protein
MQAIKANKPNYPNASAAAPSCSNKLTNSFSVYMAMAGMRQYVELTHYDEIFK